MNSNNIRHNRENALRYRSTLRLVITFSLPTILAMTIQALYVVVDRAWIGRMSDGALAMAGVGLTMPITMIAFSFIVLVGIGSTALISIRLGQKNYKEAKNVLGNCLSASFIVGLAVSIAGYLLADKLLPLFGSDAQTLPYALSYIRIFILFNAVNSVQFCMSSTMRGMGHPTWAVLTQLVGALSNMIMDPFFIFDTFTFRFFGLSATMDFGLGLGVRGAALATGLSQCLALSVVVFFFVSKKSPIPIFLRSLRPRIHVLKRIFAIGMSAFALHSVGSLVQMVANRQLSIYGGHIAVSALTIINSVMMLMVMPIIGVAQGVQPIIGYNYGAQLYRRVRKAYFSAVVFASVFAMSGAFIIQLFPDTVMRIFTHDPELLELSSKAVRVVFFMLPAMGFMVITGHYFQNIGRAFVSLMLTVLRQTVFLIPLLFIFPRIWGMEGFFYAMPVSDATALLLATVVMGFEMRRIGKLLKIKEESLGTSDQS